MLTNTAVATHLQPNHLTPDLTGRYRMSPLRNGLMLDGTGRHPLAAFAQTITRWSGVRIPPPPPRFVTREARRNGPLCLSARPVGAHQPPRGQWLVLAPIRTGNRVRIGQVVRWRRDDLQPITGWTLRCRSAGSEGRGRPNIANGTVHRGRSPAHQ